MCVCVYVWVCVCFQLLLRCPTVRAHSGGRLLWDPEAIDGSQGTRAPLLAALMPSSHLCSFFLSSIVVIVDDYVAYARDLFGNLLTFDEEKAMLLLRNCGYDFIK